ncbi:2OG-Fe(II) oxygenase [Hypericibacter sp.]|uniref:2OG-Fe(II) oxygenase n=1 Tax=Hypericibacter sp. TaxID=2705401 RepID=UPI003D6D0BB2
MPASLPGAVPLEAGDPAPPVGALDETGTPVFTHADLVTGRPLVLLFCPADGDSLQETLIAFRDRGADFAGLDALLFAFSRMALEANRATHAALQLPFKLMSDPTGNIHEIYGAEAALLAVILDRNHRIARILRAPSPAALADSVLACLRAGFPPRGLRVQTQAPILLLPRVLGEADCARLVQLFHRPVNAWRSDGFHSEGHDRETGDFKVDHAGAYGQLTEYVVREPGAQKFLDHCFNRRVAREIRKAFQTRVGQREDYRIARYDSASGGVLRAHRDNATKETAHRRFTMTINLNAGDYEGGALRFREYGDHYYEVERGTAVIWSATLLHEVMPVTKGARFVLGVHMYGN